MPIAARLGLGVDDLTRPRAELHARILGAAQRDAGQAAGAGWTPPAALRERFEAALAGPLAAIEHELPAIDPDLSRPVARTRAAIVANLDRLLERYARSLVRREEIAGRRLDRVLGTLLPGGVPQERHLGWAWLAAWLGPGELRARVARALVPLSGELRDLDP
jgi:hypothetical protein